MTDIKELSPTKDTVRLEAFSDGVFAIAITLLILEIHVPVANPNETLLQCLSNEWASFLALLIGFFTLLVCWINHHFMFSMIHKSNSMLFLINGFKLLVVTITPFATAVLSKNIQTTWQQPAVNIYCFNFTLMGFAMMCIWRYAVKMGFAKTDSDLKLKIIRNYYILASVISLSIWLVSFFSITGCLLLSAAMFIVFIFPERMVAWWMSRLHKNENQP